MDPTREAPVGLGPSATGPTFVSGAPAPFADGPTRPGHVGTGPSIHPPPAPRRPSTRGPAVITAALILVVAAVVGVGTALAHQSDTHIVAAPDPAPGRPSPLTTPADARIDFVTDQGTGELVLLSRSWSAHRPATPETDRRLQVRVELVCTTGTVDYDPGNFQAFDDYGRLYDVVFEAADESVLDVGTLQAGESVRGSLGFDLPRGQTTLLMTDGKDQAVTALQVPD